MFLKFLACVRTQTNSDPGRKSISIVITICLGESTLVIIRKRTRHSSCRTNQEEGDVH